MYACLAQRYLGLIADGDSATIIQDRSELGYRETSLKQGSCFFNLLTLNNLCKAT